MCRESLEDAKPKFKIKMFRKIIRSTPPDEAERKVEEAYLEWLSREILKRNLIDCRYDVIIDVPECASYKEMLSSGMLRALFKGALYEVVKKTMPGLLHSKYSKRLRAIPPSEAAEIVWEMRPDIHVVSRACWNSMVARLHELR